MLSPTKNNKAKKPDSSTATGSRGISDGCLDKGSVIVYVWRQMDAEAVAESVQASTNVKGGVVVYHGGMSSSDRSKSQSKVIKRPCFSAALEFDRI